MLRTYKFRLYPNKIQKRALERTPEICRILYNDALAERKQWEQKSRTVGGCEEYTAAV